MSNSVWPSPALSKPIFPTSGSSTSGSPATWKLLTAGGMAGAVSRTATAPLERVKILKQVSGLRHLPLTSYGTVSESLRKIFAEEGMKGFFKGNGVNVLRIGPYSSLQFFAYERFKLAFMPEDAKHLSPGRNMVVGALAGVIALTATYPLDLIRARLTTQVSTSRYRGVFPTFMLVVREEGMGALYKGLFPSLLGIGPYVAINFTTYEGLKRMVLRDDPSGGRPSVVQSLACGGLAGAIAQTFTYPIDLMRRRMQLQGLGGHSVEYASTFDGFRQIVRKDGFFGLYRGMVACYLKVVPAIAVSFATYEVMKVVLKFETR